MSGRGLNRAQIMAIIIEFVGGCHDGARMSSDSRDEQEATLTRRLYFRATREGTIGKQFKIVSDATVEYQWTEAMRRCRERFTQCWTTKSPIESIGGEISSFNADS
jgi:hypothetical protein